MTNIDLFKGAIVREVFLYINGQGIDLNKKSRWNGMACVAGTVALVTPI